MTANHQQSLWSSKQAAPVARKQKPKQSSQKLRVLVRSCADVICVGIFQNKLFVASLHLVAPQAKHTSLAAIYLHMFMWQAKAVP